MKNILAENMRRFRTKNLSESVKQQLNEQAVPLPTGSATLTMVKPPVASRHTDLGIRFSRAGTSVKYTGGSVSSGRRNVSERMDPRTLSFIYVGSPYGLPPEGTKLSLYGQKNPNEGNDIPNKLLSTAYFKPEISDSTALRLCEATYDTSPLLPGKYVIEAIDGTKKYFITFTVS